MSAPYYADDSVTLYHGDAAAVLAQLPAASIDAVVTSPPYWGLRDYGGEPEQIGLEGTPDAYVKALRLVFGECARLLKPTGTCWINLGDSYYSGKGSPGAGTIDPKQPGRTARRDGGNPLDGPSFGILRKSLVGIPWRVAFALQDDGWILRSEIIWAKRNFMPEGSAHDRPTRAHEQIFLLTRSPRYDYDADAIREESDPEQEAHNQRYAREYEEHSRKVPARGQPGNVNSLGIHSRPGKGGRNARSVWTISSTPSRTEHYASFPVEIPRRCIAAGCPEGGTVLDPFSGTGTTGEAARKLGRRYVGIDTHAPYLDGQIDRFAQAVIA